MKTLLILSFTINLCFAVVDSVTILESPFNDPSSIGYMHIEEAPYEYEVIDANSCLCGGDELTYNVYYLEFNWDAEPFVYSGSGGQPIYNQTWVDYLPCVDISAPNLTWKEHDYDSNWNYIETGGYVTGKYSVWGLSESDSVNEALCSNDEDYSEVIKAFDQVEYNQDSKIIKLESNNDKQEQINEKLHDIKSKIAVTNNELSSINDLMNLTQLNDINVNKTNDNSIWDELLNTFTSTFNFTSDMNSRAINAQLTNNTLNTFAIDDFTSDDTSTYTNFTNLFQSNLSNSYVTYLLSLGIGGYSTAPSAIQLNIYGNTYKFLDVTTFEDEVPTLRASFLSFGYLCGLVIALRSV